MDNILNPITAYRKEGKWSLSDLAALAAGEHRVGRLFQSVGGQAISLEGTFLLDAVVRSVNTPEELKNCSSPDAIKKKTPEWVSFLDGP